MVTIRDILKIDNDVDQIVVKIYDRKTGWILRWYEIGSATKSRNYIKFLYRTEIADVYQDGHGDHACKRVLINGPINQVVIGGGGWRGLTAHGTLFDRIPSEILDLEVDHMQPDDRLGHHISCYGYIFRCYVDEWDGIKGEGEEFAITEESEE